MRQFHPVEPLRDDARLVLPLVLAGVRSVVDFGCNDGQWLAECIRLGVTDVIGVDGGGMLEHSRLAGTSWYREWDLNNPCLDLGRRFDLALCIEVAEHIPDKYADGLLGMMLRHSRNILFSAAKPGQGGYGHLNEQPDEWWIVKFERLGCKCDTNIRGKLPNVSWWLKSNLMVVTK